MSNYYEELGLIPRATDIEIQSTIDTLYNQWRQAVTHPDAAMVEEANRNLRILEQMRATLTDPAKRAIYDAGMGLGGASGLADPTAVLRPMAPPRPKPTGQANTDAPETLWDCPKCQTRNPEWTQYCLKCGNVLVRRCPECGQMKSLVKTGVCGNCGISFAAATQRIELKAQMVTLNESIQAHQQVVEVLRTQLIPLKRFNSRSRSVIQVNKKIESQLAAEHNEISQRQQELQEATEKYQSLARR